MSAYGMGALSLFNSSVTLLLCHCERNEAISCERIVIAMSAAKRQSYKNEFSIIFLRDCHVTSFLAMTLCNNSGE